MLYREAGQYKTSYAADQAVFPILQDRVGLAAILLVAFVVIPLAGNSFLLQAVMIPFLVMGLATVGLNLHRAVIPDWRAIYYPRMPSGTSQSPVSPRCPSIPDRHANNRQARHPPP